MKTMFDLFNQKLVPVDYSMGIIVENSAEDRFKSLVRPSDDKYLCPACGEGSTSTIGRLCSLCGWNGDWIQPLNRKAVTE